MGAATRFELGHPEIVFHCEGVAGAEPNGGRNSSSARAPRDRFPLRRGGWGRAKWGPQLEFRAGTPRPFSIGPQSRDAPAASQTIFPPAVPQPLTTKWPCAMSSHSSFSIAKGWLGQSRIGAATRVPRGHPEIVFHWTPVPRCPSSIANHLSTCHALATHWNQATSVSTHRLVRWS
jgi:hypothetical protein